MLTSFQKIFCYLIISTNYVSTFLASCDCPRDVCISARAPFPCCSSDSDPGSASCPSQAPGALTLKCTPLSPHSSNASRSTGVRRSTEQSHDRQMWQKSVKSWSCWRAHLNSHLHFIWNVTTSHMWNGRWGGRGGRSLRKNQQKCARQQEDYQELHTALHLALAGQFISDDSTPACKTD